MRPAAVITSYVLYAYSAELQLLARQALNTFAILQVRWPANAAAGPPADPASCLCPSLFQQQHQSS